MTYTLLSSIYTILQVWQSPQIDCDLQETCLLPAFLLLPVARISQLTRSSHQAVGRRLVTRFRGPLLHKTSLGRHSQPPLPTIQDSRPNSSGQFRKTLREVRMAVKFHGTRLSRPGRRWARISTCPGTSPGLAPPLRDFPRSHAHLRRHTCPRLRVPYLRLWTLSAASCWICSTPPHL